MAHPKLSQPSSGYSGRGYKNPFADGEVVPSVTTALGALEKPGLIDWHVSNTAAFAVANIDSLLSRTEEQGMRFLQYYTRRLKPEHLDDEEVTVLNYSMGVLDDLAAVGNFIHNYVEADLNDWYTADPWREDQAEMILAYHDWKDQHDIRMICTERTVFGKGYAGTLDLIAEIDGVKYLIDIKTSRRVYESHVAQLAALGASPAMAVEVPEGTEGSVYHKIVPSVSKHHGGQADSWWKEEPIPEFQEYGILQIRPGDYDNNGQYIDPFCKLHTIPHKQVEVAFDIFQASLDARIAQRKYNQLLKEKDEA